MTQCNHTRYKAKLKPRSSCLSCWQKYLLLNPDATLKAKEITTILLLLTLNLDRLDEYTHDRIDSLERRTEPIEFQC